MLSSLLESGLQSLLELGELATGNKDKIIAVLRKHWTLSAYQMSEAYQLAFKDALSVIQSACSPSLIDVAHSKIKKQFKRQVHSYYLPTFFNADQPETAQFKTQLAKACGNLQSFAPQLFAAEIHSELDLAVLVSPKGQLNMTALLLQQLKNMTVLETEVEAFLLHQNLLGNAIEFFLRNNATITTRLAALQTAGMYDELQKATALISRLEAQGVAPRIEAEDEFKHVSSQSMQLIGEAVGKLKRTPLNPAERAKACLMAGSAAFSLGELEEARNLLEQALQLAQQDSERALVHFNLFQVYLRYSLSEFNQIAFEHLQEAIEFDTHYALHDPKLFRLEKLLGAGGMGCAFLATWLSRQRLVVLKCFWQMPQGEPHEVFNEALAMERVDSRYVPRPLSEGFYGEKAFLVTEYIENAIDGEIWLAQRGVLQGETGFQVALSLARGLQAAHECGVLHLDLKPSNLLLLETAEGVTVRIIDFGLSHIGRSLKQKALSHSKSSTLSLKMAGTWDYAPPEMKDVRLGKPTAKTDVFSYGKTLMQLYSGKSPANCRERDVPEAVQGILFDCIEEEPQQRPDVKGLIAFFENALGLDKQREAEQQAIEAAKQAAIEQQADKAYVADLEQKMRALEEQLKQKDGALQQTDDLAAAIAKLAAQTQQIQSEEEKRRILAELEAKKREADRLAEAMKKPSGASADKNSSPAVADKKKTSGFLKFLKSGLAKAIVFLFRILWETLKIICEIPLIIYKSEWGLLIVFVLLCLGAVPFGVYLVYKDYERGNMVIEGLGLLSRLKTPAEEWYGSEEKGRNGFPSVASLGGKTGGKYTTQITLDGSFSYSARFLDPAISGKLVLSYNPISRTWQCKEGTTIPEKYLPSDHWWNSKKYDCYKPAPAN